MKVLGAIALLAAATASTTGAFVAHGPQRRVTGRRPILVVATPRRGTNRPDSADAVAEAERISKEFGADSKEARVAWDIVEEMDSNDSSPAMAQPAQTISPSESRKIDYVIQINFLSCLLDETKEKLTQMRELVSQLRSLELSDPSLSKLGPDSEGLKKALQEAKAAMEVHGPGSPEAEKAWEVLEGCVDEEGECSIDAVASTNRYSAAALKAHHYYDAVVDPELLTESLDAFDSIEALGNFVQVEKNRLSKL